MIHMGIRALIRFFPALLGGSLFATSTLTYQGQLSGVTSFPLTIAALIAGFFATVVMILAMILLQVVSKTLMSLPLMLGKLVLPQVSEKDQRTAGTTLHVLIGSTWGLVFGILFNYAWLPGSLNLIVNGLLFGFVLWLLLMFMILPLVGKGFLGLKLGKYLWSFSLIGHLSYGAFLGFIFPLILLQ